MPSLPISLLSSLISLQNRQKCRFEPTLKKCSRSKASRAKKPYYMRLLAQTKRPETGTKRPGVDTLTKRLEMLCSQKEPRVRIPNSPPKTQSYQGFCPYDWAFLFSQGHIGVHDFRQELRCASRSALCPAESGYCPLHLPRGSWTCNPNKVHHPKQKFRQFRLMNVLAVLALHQLPDKVVKLQGQFLIFHIPPADHMQEIIWWRLTALPATRKKPAGHRTVSCKAS